MLGPSLSRELLALYGPLLTSAQVAEMLRYRNRDALIQAHKRAALRFALFQVPGRKGMFAKTSEVAAWIESLPSYTDKTHLTEQEETP